ncbi:MAG: carboxymuconolactone decarboxylase family protein [Comamonadaceae bacterium]|nr:carboxymuconolactone decarboxylase family protein [Comamonadaceae bacterium]
MASSTHVPLVEPGTRPELAELENTIRAERGGEIAVLYQALLNSPSIASGWEKMLTAVRNRTSLPADLRELVILRVAVINRASFEFEAHAPHARSAGVSEEKIEAVRSWPDQRDLFTSDEQLSLDLADAMTRDIEVPEALMQKLRARFDARGVVEMVATVAAYNMVSRFLVALNIVH